MFRERTASMRVRAPSTSQTESMQHILTADTAGAAAESQVQARWSDVIETDKASPWDVGAVSDIVIRPSVCPMVQLPKL